MSILWMSLFILGAGTWRKTPWINLRGFWLEEVGFEIGTPYTIEVYDKKLVFTAD